MCVCVCVCAHAHRHRGSQFSSYVEEHDMSLHSHMETEQQGGNRNKPVAIAAPIKLLELEWIGSRTSVHSQHLLALWFSD